MISTRTRAVLRVLGLAVALLLAARFFATDFEHRTEYGNSESTIREYEKSIVLILGGHRSGTSALSHVASDCLHFPLTRSTNRSLTVFDYKVDTDEPDGWFEHKKVTEIQEKLLIALDREWHKEDRGLLKLPSTFLNWPETIQAKLELERVIEYELGLNETDQTDVLDLSNGLQTWLVKDPRSSLFLPLWHAALASLRAKYSSSNLRIKLHYVLAIRNPNAVAASIAKRNKVSLEFGKRSWAHHVRTGLRESQGNLSGIIDYDTLLADPVSALNRLTKLASSLGLPDPDRACLDRILSPIHRHHAHNTLNASNTSDASDPSDLLFRTLLEHTQTNRPLDPASLASLGYPQSTPQKPTVAIIMRITVARLPVFGKRAMRSILGQEFGDWLLVVVVTPALEKMWAEEEELLSESEVSELVRSADDFLRPYQPALSSRAVVIPLSNRSATIESATNLGFSRVGNETRFGIIHDIDDTWHPSFLSTMVSTLSAHARSADSETQGVVCRTLQLPESEGLVPNWANATTIPRTDWVALGDLVYGNIYPPIAFLFSLSAYRELGGFDERLRVLGDWEYNLRFLERWRIEFVPETLAVHYRRPHGLHPNTARDLHLATFREIWDRWIRTAAREKGGLKSIGLFKTDIAFLDGLVRAKGEEWIHFEQKLRAKTLFRPPSAWEGGPEFLIIGAQKSGTSWLARNLAKDGRVWVPPWGGKEVHYFDQIYPDPGSFLPGGELKEKAADRWAAFRRANLAGLLSSAGRTGLPSKLAESETEWMVRYAFPSDRRTDDAWYLSLFRDIPPGKPGGEATPAYALLPPPGIAHVKRILGFSNRGGGGKILVCLRDPVDRAVAGLLHTLRAWGGDEPVQNLASSGNATAWLDAFGIDEEGRTKMDRIPPHLRDAGAGSTVERSRYARMLRRWDVAFRYPETLKIVWFDEIRENSADTLYNAVRYLVSGHEGADLPRIEVPGVDEVVNPGIGRGHSKLVPASVVRALRKALKPDLTDLVRFLELRGRKGGIDGGDDARWPRKWLESY